jgi:RhtB (resistance to homoserine/threonine) family protein
MITFIIVVLTLFLIPGPAVILTISQTLKGGMKNGIVTGLGIALGDLIHTFAAVLGISAILMASAFAFEVVKYVGAVYLVYLGISALINKSKKVQQPKAEKVNTNLSFRQALWIELLNPKTALFFLAFLPQFVRSDSHPVTFQLLLLGLTFVLMSIIYTSFLAFLTSVLGEKIYVKNNRRSHWMEKVAGIVYIGLGLKLAFQTQK